MSIDNNQEVINTVSIDDVNLDNLGQVYVDDDNNNKVEVKEEQKHFLQALREAIDKQIANDDNLSFNTEDEFEMKKEAINDPSYYWNIVKSELDSTGNVIGDEERINEIKDDKKFKLEQEKRVKQGLPMEDYYPDLDMNVRIRTLQQDLSNENGANKTFDLNSTSEETLRNQIGSQGGL